MRYNEVMEHERMKEVYSRDNVFESKSGCLIWLGPYQTGGYARIDDHLLSRIILERALGRPIRPGMFACHTCDTPACVEESHIYEGTPQQNVDDMISRGRVRFSSKLTETHVTAIRKIHEYGYSQKSIVDVFGVSAMRVSNIVRRRSWNHV